MKRMSSLFQNNVSLFLALIFAPICASATVSDTQTTKLELSSSSICRSEPSSIPSENPLISVEGPFLLFREQNLNTKTWHLDALVIADASVKSETLSLQYNSCSLQSEIPSFQETINTTTLYSEDLLQKNFFLFSLSLPQIEHEYQVTYQLKLNGAPLSVPRQNKVTVPGLHQDLHFITTSCNGFSRPGNESLIGPIENTWKEILNRYQKYKTRSSKTGTW